GELQGIALAAAEEPVFAEGHGVDHGDARGRGAHDQCTQRGRKNPTRFITAWEKSPTAAVKTLNRRTFQVVDRGRKAMASAWTAKRRTRAAACQRFHERAVLIPRA